LTIDGGKRTVPRSMKKIPIPAPIQLHDPATGKPVKAQFGDNDIAELFSFKRYAFLYWLTDPRWHAHLARLAIVAPLFNREVGDIHLEDHDYAVLESILKAPGERNVPNNPLIALQLLAFPEAVLSARKDPEPADPG
jgi:hypothetical protein